MGRINQNVKNISFLKIMSNEGEELPSSELGTKEYWDKQYELEKKNFDEIGDKGEVWFGEAAMNRMVRWLEKNTDPESKIIDLGCGNGMMSIELYEAGFHNVDGVDYSQHAIDLAKKLAQDSDIDDVNFFQCDILSQPLEEELLNKYKVCVDKGTYDAISLCKDNASEMRKLYRSAVHQMLSVSEKTGQSAGLFFITSCNWTEDELKTFFSTHFSVKTVLPTPKFQFGGVTGSTVTSIVFEKK